MKKLVIAMVLVAVASSLQAASTAVFNVVIGLGTANSALSTVDTESSPVSQLVTTSKNLFEKEGSNLSQAWLKKDASGTLSDGYSVYYISGKTYADTVKMLGEDQMSFLSFVQTYQSSVLNEAIVKQGVSSQMCYAYNIDNSATKYMQLNTNVANYDALDGNAAVIFTYHDEDWTVAQYNVIKFSEVSGSYQRFEGTATGSSGSSTGWMNFAAPIPEPTTGMLMLLGLAGLVLKRKRA